MIVRVAHYYGQVDIRLVQVSLQKAACFIDPKDFFNVESLNLKNYFFCSSSSVVSFDIINGGTILYSNKSE